MTYAEKLKDPRWQRKRLQIMERDKFTCRFCRSKDKTLNVHHKIYTKGKSPWEYEDYVFVTLCEDCHKWAEMVKEDVLMTLGRSVQTDLSIQRLCLAVAENPTGITFLGWAARGIAGCVNAYFSVERGEATSDQMLEEFRENAREAVADIHRALFDFEKKCEDHSAREAEYLDNEADLRAIMIRDAQLKAELKKPGLTANRIAELCREAKEIHTLRRRLEGTT